MSLIDLFKNKNAVCRNCGHPVERYLCGWYHLNDITGMLSNRCQEHYCECPYPKPK